MGGREVNVMRRNARNTMFRLSQALLVSLLVLSLVPLAPAPLAPVPRVDGAAARPATYIPTTISYAKQHRVSLRLLQSLLSTAHGRAMPL